MTASVTHYSCTERVHLNLKRRSMEGLCSHLTGLALHYKVISNAIISCHRDLVFSFFVFAFKEKQERDPRTDKRTDGPTTAASGQQLFLMLLLVCKALRVASSYVIAQLLMLLRTSYVGQSVRRGMKKKKKQTWQNKVTMDSGDP